MLEDVAVFSEPCGELDIVLDAEAVSVELEELNIDDRRSPELKFLHDAEIV